MAFDHGAVDAEMIIAGQPCVDCPLDHPVEEGGDDPVLLKPRPVVRWWVKAVASKHSSAGSMPKSGFA